MLRRCIVTATAAALVAVLARMDADALTRLPSASGWSLVSAGSAGAA